MVGGLAVSAVLQPGKADSAGSQFFVCVTDQPALDGKHTIFGYVSDGIDVVQKISEADADANGLPVARIVGNVVLSLLTKLTSGHLHVFDSQCGYTAASRRALQVLDETGLFPRYGYPNYVLARLWGARLRVADVPVRAVYGPGWRSGIGLSTVIYPMSFVLLGSFFRRWAMRVGGAPVLLPGRRAP